MVRPLILTAGSRGDHEPLLALAESPELDNPVLFVQRDYLSLAPQAHVLPFSLEELMLSFQYSMERAAPNENPFNTMWRAFGHCCVHQVLPSVDSVLEVAQKSSIDVVLSTTITWMVAHIVAEKLGVPVVLLTLQPDLPSRHVPHPCIAPEKAADAFEKILNDEKPDQDDENILTYSRLHSIASTEFLISLNECRTRLGLLPIDEKRAAAILDGNADVPSLVACSPLLSPAPPDWKPANRIVGSLAASFVPKDYVPEERHPELCRFLDDGPPPVVVSYGSMGSMVDPAKLTLAVLSGLRDVDVQRVVMLPGAARLDVSLLDQDSELAMWARNAVLTVTASVQYSYLLPRSSMLLCHGGAGSTMAALNAGIPVVITPVLTDQPFYGEMVTRLQLGAATPIGLGTLEPEMIATAVKIARSDNVVKNAREFAKRERDAIPPVTRVVRALKDIAATGSSKR